MATVSGHLSLFLTELCKSLCLVLMIGFRHLSSLPDPTRVPITSQISQSLDSSRKVLLGAELRRTVPTPPDPLKSTNRLSRPNVIKSEPGSGAVSVPILSAPREQGGSSASSSLGKTSVSVEPAPGRIFWKGRFVASWPRSSLLPAAQWKPPGELLLGVAVSVWGLRAERMVSADCWAAHRQLDMIR